MRRVDDFRLLLGEKEYIPLLIGGMGVDISTTEMALEAARLGGIGHISDAMIPAVADKHTNTEFVKGRRQKYKDYASNPDKSEVQFDLETIVTATRLYVEKAMNAKKGEGGIFVNCMEKVTMNNPKATLKARLTAAMDAGIDGITLSAGLHLGSFDLIKDHPRFEEVKLGIIVSSLRALKPFLKRAARTQRKPDYIVVEGPLAGGHLGFGENWSEFNLQDIVLEIIEFIHQEGLEIPVIPAGGIFTGTDAVEYLNQGAAAVQVATRFTIAEECGLPYKVKQKYLQACEEDVEVNSQSPTGYLMRMLKQSPAIGSNIRPGCEAFGYLLDGGGKCSYLEAYNRELAQSSDNLAVREKTCLCTGMLNYNVWTCGHYVYRLKDTTNQLPDGSYQIPSTEHIFNDYLLSTDHSIKLPPLPQKSDL
ncbi:nitronate monooxygenase [Deltaproteobacteria bacterium TL4]